MRIWRQRCEACLPRTLLGQGLLSQQSLLCSVYFLIARTPCSHVSPFSCQPAASPALARGGFAVTTPIRGLLRSLHTFGSKGGSVHCKNTSWLAERWRGGSPQPSFLAHSPSTTTASAPWLQLFQGHC